MKQKTIVKIVLLAMILPFGAWHAGSTLVRPAEAAGIGPIIDKLETYVEQQGFIWQQIKSRTPKQWYNHAIAAGCTPKELRQFVGGQNVLRSEIVKRKKRAIVVAEATALLLHIREAGRDDKTFPLIRDIFENWEDYDVDPNAIL